MVRIGPHTVTVAEDGTAVCPRCRERLPLAVIREHILGLPSWLLRPLDDEDDARWTQPAEPVQSIAEMRW